MAEVKPAEVSAILRQQFQGIKSEAGITRGWNSITSRRWYRSEFMGLQMFNQGS